MWSLGRYLTNNIKRCHDVADNSASGRKTQVTPNAGKMIPLCSITYVVQ